MVKSSRIRVISTGCILTLLSGALCGPLALAQEAVFEMEEIIVTASRRAENIQDAAVAVTVLDTEGLAQAGHTDLNAILPFVPGVNFQNTGVPWNNDIYIRGINAISASGVGTYIDDIAYGSQTVYADEAKTIEASLLDVESINVLKGPQGTLYGASSLSGLIKYRTRSPSLDEWSSSVSLNVSDTSGGGLNQIYRVSLNGPFSTDKAGISFTGFWSDKSGYINNTAIPLDNWDDNKFYGASGSFLYQPTDVLSFKLQGLFQKSEELGAATIETNNDGTPAFGEYETRTGVAQPNNFESSVVGLTIEYDLGIGTLSSITSFQEMERTSSTDFTLRFGPFADFFFPATAPHTVVAFTDVSWEKTTQELRLVSSDSDTFEWIVGGYYNKEEGLNTQDFVTTPSQNFAFGSFPSEYVDKSVFATGTWFFTPVFDASLGVRFSRTSNAVELFDGGSLLVSPVAFNKIEDNVTTYLLNARYRATDNMSVYSRIATGFRPGGANFLYTDPVTGAPLTDPLIDSDTLTSYEFGVKGTSDNGRFNYDLAAYYISWEDYITIINVNGLVANANADEASSRGVEASLGFAATDSLRFQSTIAYTDAQHESEEPDLGAPAGSQLPNSSKWDATLAFDYGFEMGGLPWYLGGSWIYKGETPVGYTGYTDAGGTVVPPTTPRLDVDSYSLVNLNLGFTTERFDASLFVNNLFGEYGFYNFATTPSSTNFAEGTPIRPRTIGVQVKIDF